MATPNTDSLGVGTGDASEMAQRVADTIDQNRDDAASAMESTAGALREKADTIPGGERAASAVGAAADYVRETDMKAMLADVQRLVKSNPGPALLIAAGLGFLIARTFSHD